MNKFIRLPTHILRDKCIFDIIRNLRKGRFLEIGPGIGETTAIFLKRQFVGVCYDLSPESRVVLREKMTKYSNELEIIDTLSNLKPDSFDYLFSFDVLEHILDDSQALNKWMTYLKRDGWLLVSMPAHSKIYGISDKLMGHIKRYEKKELFNLLKSAGCKDIKIFNYGFPLINLTVRCINLIYQIFGKSCKEYDSLALEEKSMLSGTKSPNIATTLSFLFNELCLMPFIMFQRFFYDKDYGPGYVAYGKKA